MAPPWVYDRSLPVLGICYGMQVLVHQLGGKVAPAAKREYGHAFLPGGHVEFGEPAREALEREVREELGIDLVADRFLGAMEACFDQAKPSRRGDPPGSAPLESPPANRRHHEINLVFSLRPRPPKQQVNPVAMRSQESGIEFIWVSLNDLLSESPTVTLLPPGIVNLVAAELPPGRPPGEHLWQSRWE